MAIVAFVCLSLAILATQKYVGITCKRCIAKLQDIRDEERVQMP